MGKKEHAAYCVKHLRRQVPVCGSYLLKAEFFTRRPVNYVVGAFEQLLVAPYAFAVRSGML
jgi:hypothetical protein